MKVFGVIAQVKTYGGSNGVTDVKPLYPRLSSEDIMKWI